MSEQHSTTQPQPPLDVLVIGGGSAGLSAALTLARARRSVLVIDAGQPRNAAAAAAHGLPARDGTPPLELLRAGRAEVTGYGGRIVEGRVADARPVAGGFRVSTADGREHTARRLLLATGVVDELPDVPGLRERWGRDVLHCPYCHGWEIGQAPAGVLGGGPAPVHRALLLRQWSPEVTLFTHTGEAPAPEDARRLAARGIAVEPGRVTGIDVVEDRLTGVVLEAGRRVPLAALLVAPRLVARGAAFTGLGLRIVEHPSGAGEYVPADPTGLTEVPGVWAAGNVRDPLGNVVTAQADGVRAAAAVNADLVAADTDAALAAA